MATVDRDWFFERLRERNRSLRGLARHLGLDPAVVSRMLNGKRRMQMTEAAGVATFLGVATSDVLRHVGVEMVLEPASPPPQQAAAEHPAEPGPDEEVEIVAEIGADGGLTATSKRREIVDYIRRGLAAAAPPPERRIGAVVRDEDGPLAMLDDVLVVFHPGTHDIDARAAGQLAIVRPSDGGAPFLCRVERARRTGEVTVRRPDGRVEELQASEVAPVELIRA